MLAQQSYTPFQQHWAFGEVVRAFGGDVHRGVVSRDGNPVATAQIVVRHALGCSLNTLMMGPCWLAGDLSTEVRSSALELIGKTAPIGRRAILLTIPKEATPDAEQALNLRRVVSGYHTVLIDLTSELSALEAALDGKWRNRLRAAETSGISVSRLGKSPAQYQFLLDGEVRQQRHRGYKALPPNLVPAFQEQAGRDSVMALEAKQGAERVGGILFLRHGQTATYHIGWTTAAGREASANNLLLWRGMELLKKQGAKTLDLGGVDTDQTPGIARFKLAMGGEVLTQSGTWLLWPRLW